MTLSLKNVIRSLFNGSSKNGNSSRFPHENESPARLTKTLLFVDDEPSILSMRRLVFEALGYSVLTAISGEEALETLEQCDVDAVVLDYLMPGMDGEETARHIRKLRRGIPIILSTGYLKIG